MSNFTRIGSRCYHFSSDAVNWKSASYACRKLKANLLELDLEEKKQFVIGVQANKNLKGKIYITFLVLMCNFHSSRIFNEPSSSKWQWGSI